MGRRKGSRVLGPYDHKASGRCYLVFIAAEGSRRVVYFDSRAEAARAAEVAEEENPDRRAVTVGLALSSWEKVERRRLKASSVAATFHRLRMFLPLGRELHTLTAQAVQGLVEDKLSDGLSVAYVSGMLSDSRRFFAWCQRQGWTAPDVAGVSVEGRRSAGKEQLNIDESRLFVAECLRQGGERGTAALALLVLGVRSMELLSRTARDLDDGGAVFCVPSAKTRAGVRRLCVPDLLRPLLLERAAGKPPSAFLWPASSACGHRTRPWLRDVVADICDAAGVPTVCPHALRGGHASLAVAAGVAPVAVAASLGHTSVAMTEKHYTTPTAAQDGQQRRFLRAIEGGLSTNESDFASTKRSAFRRS